MRLRTLSGAIVATALLAAPALALSEADQYVASGNGKNARYDYGGAIEDFDQALEIDSNNVFALNGRCWARALWKSNFRQAMDDCNKALRLKPYDAATLNSRGFLNYRMGEWQKSVDDYTQAIRYNWKNASSYYMRGQSYLKLGDKTKAKFDFDKANELDAGIRVKYQRYDVPWPPISL